MIDDLIRKRIRCCGSRIQTQLRIDRRLIWAIDPGEVADLTRTRLLVEPLHIALLSDCQRRINVHLEELALQL